MAVITRPPAWGKSSEQTGKNRIGTTPQWVYNKSWASNLSSGISQLWGVWPRLERRWKRDPALSGDGHTPVGLQGWCLQIPDLCRWSEGSSRQQEQIAIQCADQQRARKETHTSPGGCADLCWQQRRIAAGIKKKQTYLPGWELQFFQMCQQQAHPANRVLTPLPQALGPLASSILMVHSSVLCLMLRAKNAEHSNARHFASTTGHQEDGNPRQRWCRADRRRCI